MNDLWEDITVYPKVQLGKVCIIDPSKKELNGLAKSTIVSFGMMNELPEHKPIFSPSEKKEYGQIIKGGYSYFREGDVVLAKMTPCFENGKSGIARSLLNGIGFGSTEFYVIRNKELIIPDWIYAIISSKKFIEKGKYSLVGTTGRRRLIKQFIESFEIPLPPVEIQQKLAGLFQAIDKAIEQTEAQERNLCNLQTKLVAGLVEKKPHFGSLLTRNSCQPITFGEIANEMRVSSKEPLAEGITRFVGLENIESGNLKIKSWGNVADGTTFTKTFQPGDVLFGKRRAYLKKAAVADFGGLCSGDILVLRAKEEIILPELFPYYASADAFFEHAVSTSAGSLSPRTKWKDLAKFKFSIPHLKMQGKIFGVFKSLQKNIDLNATQGENLKKLKHKLLDEILG